MTIRDFATRARFRLTQTFLSHPPVEECCPIVYV